MKFNNEHIKIALIIAIVAMLSFSIGIFCINEQYKDNINFLKSEIGNCTQRNYYGQNINLDLVFNGTGNSTG